MCLLENLNNNLKKKEIILKNFNKLKIKMGFDLLMNNTQSCLDDIISKYSSNNTKYVSLLKTKEMLLIKE